MGGYGTSGSRTVPGSSLRAPRVPGAACGQLEAGSQQHEDHPEPGQGAHILAGPRKAVVRHRRDPGGASGWGAPRSEGSPGRRARSRWRSEGVFPLSLEATAADLMRAGRLAPLMGGRVGGDFQWRVPFAAPSAAIWIAMYATQYFHRFGGGRETLGWLALNARANAARNPDAIYRDPLTMDDYLGARMISTPLGLYDCDVPCDGAIALVVSALDASADTPNPVVRVEAVGTQITEHVSWDQGTITHEPMVFGPAAHLWSRTDLSQADVDVAEIYDGFTFNCVTWLEALGFCGIGEASDFLEGARASPSTATCRSTRTVVSSRRGAPRASASFMKRSSSCAATEAIVRSRVRRSRPLRRAVACRAGRCC